MLPWQWQLLKDVPYYVIPSPPCQTWFGHAEFGDEFKKILDSIHEEWGEQPANPEPKKEDGPGPDQKDAGRKRKITGTPGTASSKKASKVDRSKISTIEEVGDAQKLMEVTMMNAKGSGLCLHIKTQNRVYIFNRSETEVVLPRGSIIAGFGRGKFKRVANNAEDGASAKDVPYILEGPATEVPWFPCHCFPLRKILQCTIARFKQKKFEKVV